MLLSAKENSKINACTHKYAKTPVTLDQCKGYLDKFKGNAINYDPTRQNCNIKACEDEDDARSNLIDFTKSGPYDVYYCYRE